MNDTGTMLPSEIDKREQAMLINRLNNRIDVLTQQVSLINEEKNTLARANRDLQTQLNAVKECFETIVKSLTAGRSNDY